MGLFEFLTNPEQAALSGIKKELNKLPDEELRKIASKEVRTGLFSSGRRKQYQIAAWQLLRERELVSKNSN